jgi:ribosome maturation factor RimP
MRSAFLAGKKPTTVSVAADLIAPILQENGLALWDVRFEKEGGQWYLRYLIERIDGSLTIEDCEKTSRAVEKRLDEADPVEQSYILEVGSPGIERELVRDSHFERYIGHSVMLRTIRPIDGKRDFTGVLTGYDGKELSIEPAPGQLLTFERREIARCRLHVDFDDGGQRE